jgi:hypothetical protein
VRAPKVQKLPDSQRHIAELLEHKKQIIINGKDYNLHESAR